MTLEYDLRGAAPGAVSEDSNRGDTTPSGSTIDLFAAAYPDLLDQGWLDLPLVRARPDVSRRMARALKRAADVAISLVLLIVLLPFLAIVAAVIRIDSPGNPLFRQERVGRFGKTFRIVKFRTMKDGAQHQESEIVSRCAGDPRFRKLECDPRVTRLGGLLRRTSIDELPQLWNVLSGDMSLVGPRPSQPKEVAHYSRGHLVRLLVKPGVTGMWQVSGRSNLGFEQAVVLDSEYIENWSLGLDARILLRTVKVVVQCEGAC